MQDGGQLDRGLGLAEVAFDEGHEGQGGDGEGLVLAAGPAGCAQSCGTHTVPHLAAIPSTAQTVSVVLGRGDGEAEEDGLVPPQPAAVSATAATSAAHHPGRGADTAAETLPVRTACSPW